MGLSARWVLAAVKVRLLVLLVPSPTTSASWTFQNSSVAPSASPKLLVPASWPPAVKSSLSINWLSKHQRDKTPSFSKAQESKELLASISEKLQVDPAQEPSHLSDPRAENSNKPVVDVPPEVTRSNSVFSVFLTLIKLMKSRK